MVHVSSAGVQAYAKRYFLPRDPMYLSARDKMAANSETVHPDLVKERQRATFDPEQLTNFIYNGPERTKRKRYLRECSLLS